MNNKNRVNSHRKYNLDENIFDEPLTEESSYWIGFLMADGNVSKKKQGESQQVTIHLKLGDILHLEKFRDFIKSDRPIYIGKCGCGSSNKIYSNCMIRVFSNKIADDLERYGVIPNKTTKESNLVNIPEDLERHVFRGLVDGDGSILCDNGKKYQMELAGNYEICNQFKQFLIRNNIVSKSKVKRRENYSGILCRYRIGGNKQMPKIMNLLYGDSDIYLERKYNIAKEIMERFHDE